MRVIEQVYLHNLLFPITKTCYIDFLLVITRKKTIIFPCTHIQIHTHMKSMLEFWNTYIARILAQVVIEHKPCYEGVY